MAQAPQAAMEMPPQAANPYEDPNTMAVYDQMRQSVSPKQFGDEVLAGASQVDPQEVAKFRDELDKLDVPAEVLDMLNNMVDEILAAPEKYAEIKQKYEAMGVTEDLLPEQFDAQFFTALNMAVDQMIGAPAGPEAFAKGGIAELTPVSKAIASYGRNGDTMLAHITPAEARMLRRKGGAGTTNPKTGLKEFFSLGKLFKGIGNAIKGFVNSTVGKIVTTVALGFFLGPAAASMLGVSSAAGVAAVSGFVGSAGSTLLGGGNLSQALKAGALGGLTAGAGAGIMGGSEAFTSGSYTGPTTVGGQYDRLMGTPAAPVAPAGPSISPTGEVAGMAPVAPTEFATQADLNAAGPAPSFMDKAKDFYDNKLFPSDIQKGAIPNAQAAANAAVETQSKLLPASITGEARATMLKGVYDKAYAAAMPGTFATYAPITAAGIGAIGLAGGFKPNAPEASKLKPELMKSATQRIAEQGKQKEYYIQNLPGVKYDEFGAPIYGSTNPLPTTPAATTPKSNFNLPATVGGIGSLYTPPPGTIGAQKPVAQPYNTASMYTNLMAPPPRFAEGGAVTPPPESAAMLDAQRAALIAQAQALGQSGYTPSSPGSYGMERAAYTPSTGFAEFTRQYMRDNPAPVISRAPTGRSVGIDSPPTTVAPPIDLSQLPTGPTEPPPDVYTPPVDTYEDPYQPPNDTYVPPVDTYEDPYQPPNDTYVPPVDTYEDPYQPPNDTYVPPVDTYEDPYQPPNDTYVPPVDTYEDPYQPPTDVYQPPVDTYEDPYQPPVDVYQPPVDTYEAPYQPPADVYTPPVDVYQPPVDVYQPPADVYQPPADVYQPPMDVYQPPADVYTPPVDTYQPPVDTYQPTVYEAPSYTAPVSDYNTFGFNGGEDGGKYGDFGTSFGGSGGGFGLDDGLLMQSSFNTGGIASLRSGGYPRRTGQISGPGTATSDSIPAMLSDGEFVMTAKAVRGAGKGDRRAGAKRMYALMHQLEQNASRG